VAAALPPSTVVIATKDRPRLVREAVDSILAGESRPEEILVVDQSAEPVAVEGARTVAALAAGLSASRNQGILEAAHEIVLLIDDDILVTPGWHRAFVEALAAAGPRAVATGRVVIGEPEVPGGFSPASAVSEEPATYRGRIGTDVLAGGNMAARRQPLLEVGLFDQRLGPGTLHPSAEDNDLGFRLLEEGYEIVYVPEALAIHRAWRPDRQHLVYRWRYGLGKGGFYTKHASREDRHMLARMRKDVGPRLGRIPRSMRPGRRRAAAGDLVYVAGILAGTASWIWKERVRRRGGS
jgi:GT2 family glycosyltransferase